MRILFLSQIVPYPPHGGVLQRGYNIVREIGRRNEVHLLAFVHPDVLGTPALVEESRAALQQHCARVEYYRLWPKDSPRLGKLSYLWSGASRSPFSVIAHRSREFRTAIHRTLAAHPIDLVHYDTLALAQFMPPGRRTPSTLTHHNIESQLMARRAAKETNPLARLYLRNEAAKLRAYESAHCRDFDLNIVVSDADAQTLQSIVPGIHTQTVVNGVDVDYFRPAPAERGSTSEPALIYTGGMNMFANRDAVMYFLREIWPTVKAGMPAVRFYAVGQDPPEEVLRIAAADPQVIVTGYVDDIRPYVNRAAVYVVPLRVGGGTRLKVVDAMAMGKAIVSTRIGAEGIRVTEGRDVLLADEPQHFAETTLRLLRDPQARARLGAAARLLAEDAYSWDHVGAKLQGAYESITSGKVRRTVPSASETSDRRPVPAPSRAME